MARGFSWQVWAESMDGSVVVPLTHQDTIGHVLLQSGFLGLGVPPVDVALGVTPGVTGAFVQDVTVLARDITLPLSVWGRTDDEKWRQVQVLRDLTDPSRGMTRDGSFKLVAHSGSGPRELTVAYRSGLEGDMHGRVAPERIVLDLVAPDPIARARTDTLLSFPLLPSGPFLTRSGPYPWGTRRLSPSTIAGTDMQVVIRSGVEVWPILLLDGPAPDGARIQSDDGLDLIIDGRVPDGSTLRIVTDPRARSARLDGERAWGMVDRSSVLRPLAPGMNVMDVVSTGASASTVLRVGYRAGWRSLWEGEEAP